MKFVGEEQRRGNCVGGVREKVPGRGRKRGLNLEKTVVNFTGTPVLWLLEQTKFGPTRILVSSSGFGISEQRMWSMVLALKRIE